MHGFSEDILRPYTAESWRNSRGEEMSKRENYETRTEELLVPIAEANHVEIYDVEYVKEGSDWYLRCYIDKEEGVSIDDCEAVSRMLSDRLDETDFITDAYILEVSSPGLGRQLKKDRHLAKSLLKEVDVKTYKPIDGAKEFRGILKSFDENTITLGITTSGDKSNMDKSNMDKSNMDKSNLDLGEVVFNRKEIAAIKLTLDF